METDTLIIETTSGYEIEKYKDQNLDEYCYIAELNHEQLVTFKTNNYYFMKTITLTDIFNYLKKEFDSKF